MRATRIRSEISIVDEPDKTKCSFDNLARVTCECDQVCRGAGGCA
jgi:hypothetical protein